MSSPSQTNTLTRQPSVNGNGVRRRRSTGIVYQSKKKRRTSSLSLANTPAAEEEQYECAICLDNCRLPFITQCKHVFCFLCLKSSLHLSAGGRCCPMCRAPIDLNHVESTATVAAEEFLADIDTEYVWRYSGKNNGFWLYDPACMQELERGWMRWRGAVAAAEEARRRNREEREKREEAERVQREAAERERVEKQQEAEAAAAAAGAESVSSATSGDSAAEADVAVTVEAKESVEEPTEAAATLLIDDDEAAVLCAVKDADANVAVSSKDAREGEIDWTEEEEDTEEAFSAFVEHLAREDMGELVLVDEDDEDDFDDEDDYEEDYDSDDDGHAVFPPVDVDADPQLQQEVTKLCCTNISVGGQDYVVDYERMVQYPARDMARQRRVERVAKDQTDGNKGVSGIRFIRNQGNDGNTHN